MEGVSEGGKAVAAGRRAATTKPVVKNLKTEGLN